ncbi:MAG: hypothetical protein QOI20_2311, partial [Acidimicrobiaceae bacterium]|nr:hypothetical protein [Acidimicrobiaceae bacterium]
MTGLPSNGDRQATTGRAGTAVATAIALAVLLLVDLIAVVVLPRPITLHGPGALADVIPELQHFVEHARGLRFHHNVDIRLS